MVRGQSVPLYDLEVVRQAAREQAVQYRGRRVNLDILNLGYELDDVCRCLLLLTRENFYKSHHYEGRPGDDAYRLSAPRPASAGEGFDDLYIKFCVIGDEVLVELGSFHLQR
ncbi:MAG: type II toxin-antitoxin system MqsR family toxin [Balneolaceae bacterium]|nr:type II toxin-antitoxin system MqsR family toxin [Balneolaceae bacterium]